MSGPQLEIGGSPALVILSVGDRAPGLNYPLIAGVGTIRQPADGKEAGNVAVDLDNADGAASRLFAVPPLLSPCTLYGPDGAVWFEGVLAGAELGEAATLTLES